MQKLVIVDANAIIHRAYHALPPLSTARGEPVGALYGLASFLLKTIREIKPDHIVACFDRPEPTFRHEEFEAYKATRPKAPVELISQIIKAHELFEKFGISIFESAGFEADDVIATVCDLFKNEADVHIIIVSGDLDTLQLVSGKRVIVYVPKKGISEIAVYDEEGVKERFGLLPCQLPDFKGLKGDPSDNVPGIKGIGEKTASRLIGQFGSLENLYEKLPALDAQKNKKSEKTLYEKLSAHKDEAVFSKYLTTLRADAPIEFSLDALSFGGLKKELLSGYFRELGFHSLLPRLEEGYTPKFHGAPQTLFDARRDTSGADSPGTASGPREPVSFDAVQQKLFIITEVRNGTVERIKILAGGTAEEKSGSAVLDEKKGFENGATEKIGYNLKPLIAFLRKNGSDLRGTLFDVKIAAWLLGASPKENGAGANVDQSSLSQLYERQRKDLAAKELTKVFYDIEMPFLSVLADMEMQGITVDSVRLKQLEATLKKELQEIRTAIYEAAGAEFNVNSSKQVAHVLFQILKLPTKGIRKTAGGVLSTDASELEKLAALHPIITPLLRYRELFKLQTTYIQALPNYIDPASGKLHTTFQQTGTVTGRLSSQHPNLQNIPLDQEYAPGVRRAFVADEGLTFVSCDYSQIELRIAASLADDERMITAFTKGQDIHTMTAAEINGVSIESVSAQMRKAAKTLNFGIMYGMGADSFAAASGLGKNEAKRFIEKYFGIFSGIRQYQQRVVEFGREHGYVVNAVGRRRWLEDLVSPNQRDRAAAERMAINFPIQSLDADIMKLAMIAIERIFRERGRWGTKVRLVLQIHDQLLFEISNDILKETRKEIKEIMESAYTLRVPLRVDIKTGKNWADMQ